MWGTFIRRAYPDRPPLDQTVTDDLPKAWYASADAEIAERLHGGQGGTTAEEPSAGEASSPAPTLFILAHVASPPMQWRRKT